jgi:hypothetical protein
VPNVRNVPIVSNELNGLIVPTGPTVPTDPTDRIGLIVPTGPIVRVTRPEFPALFARGALNRRPVYSPAHIGS